METEKTKIEKEKEKEFLSQPLRLDKHPLNNSITHAQSMMAISKNFMFYREVKADNNCFYTSFISLLPKICKSLTEDTFQEILGKMVLVNTQILVFTYESSIFMDFYESFLEFLQTCRSNSDIDPCNLDDMDVLSMVTYLKIAISIHIQSNPEIYQPFVTDMPLEEYCKKNVEPLYSDIEYIGIHAFTNAIGISVEVFALDRGNSWLKFGDFEAKVRVLNFENHFEPIYN